MNDVNLKESVHLEIDVLHVHLIQVYQRLVLHRNALFDPLHLQVNFQTRAICKLSITNLSWLNKTLFCQVMVRIFDCSVNFDFVIACSLCKVHLDSLFSKFLSIMSEIRIRASCIFVIVFIWRFSIIRKSFSWKVIWLLHLNMYIVIVSLTLVLLAAIKRL